MKEDMGASVPDQALAVPAKPASGLVPSGFDPSRWASCPFDDRLARTPYLVLPKLALQAMPMEWRNRFEAMLVEMDDAGLETPAYLVLRDERPYAWCVHEDEDDEFSRLDRVEVYLPDPWANYRHGNAMKLSREAAIAMEAAKPSRRETGSTEGDSAGPQDIAQPPPESHP